MRERMRIIESICVCYVCVCVGFSVREKEREKENGREYLCMFMLITSQFVSW